MPIEKDYIENLRLAAEDAGYIVPDSAQFRADMRDKDVRKQIFDKLTKDDYLKAEFGPIGGMDAFNNGIDGDFRGEVARKAYTPGTYGRKIQPGKPQQQMQAAPQGQSVKNTMDNVDAAIQQVRQQQPAERSAEDKETAKIMRQYLADIITGKSIFTPGFRYGQEQARRMYDLAVKEDPTLADDPERLNERLKQKNQEADILLSSDIADELAEKIVADMPDGEIGTEVSNTLLDTISKKYNDIIRNTANTLGVHDMGTEATSENAYKNFMGYLAPALARRLKVKYDGYELDTKSVPTDYKTFESRYTLEQRIKDAEAEHDQLEELLKKRGAELDAENDGKWWRNLARGSGGGIHTTNAMDNNGRNNDTEYLQLLAALDKNDDLLRDLKARRDESTGTFLGGMWRGFRDYAFDLSNWDGGYRDMLTSSAMLRTKLGVPETKREKEAERHMLGNALAADVAAEEAERTLGNGYRFMRIGAQSLPFALRFTAGNVTGMTSGLARGGEALGAKLARKITAKEGGNMMLRDFARTVVRNTGVALGDLAAATALSGTYGAGQTASDVLNRYTGNVTYDPATDEYRLENGESFGKALYHGVANSVIENYTEMLGEHIHLGGLGKSALPKVGLGRASDWFTKVGNTGFMKGVNKYLKLGGFNGYPQEVLEEEIGIPLHAIFDGGNKFSDLLDGRQQLDIVGGMLFSMAAMGAGTTVLYGAKRGGMAVMYQHDRHKVDNAGRVAAYRLTSDKWEPIKDKIDNATNKELSGVIYDILSDKDLSVQEKEAVWDYTQKLITMRGHNMGQVAATRGGTADKDTNTANELYTEGYNAEGEVLNDIKLSYENARKAAEETFSPEDLKRIDDDPVGFLGSLGTGEDTKYTRKAALEYMNAKTAYDGMMQRAKDDLDGKVQEVELSIDSHVQSRDNGGDGMIHPVTMKTRNDDGTEQKAYVVSGNVVMTADGTMVDNGRSSQSIVIRHEDGRLEMVSPNDILSADEAVDPEEEKKTATETVRQQFAQQRADEIDGTLKFAQGEQYTIIGSDNEQHSVQVVNDNGDGTITAIWDGQQDKPVQLKKDDVQSMNDAYKAAQLNVQNDDEAQGQGQGQRDESVRGLEKRPELWAGSAVITPATDSATESVTSRDAQQGGGQSGSASDQSTSLSDVKLGNESDNPVNDSENVTYEPDMEANPTPGEDVYVKGEDGKVVHGKVAQVDDLEGNYIVQTDDAVNGKTVQPYKKEELLYPATQESQGDAGQQVQAADEPQPVGPSEDTTDNNIGSDFATQVAEYDQHNGTELGRFIDYLDNGKQLKDGESRHFRVGHTEQLLNSIGINGDIAISTSTVGNRHTKNNAHNLSTQDWYDVINDLNTPLAVTKYGDGYRIYTHVKIDGGKSICAGVEVRKVGHGVEITNIKTAFGRDLSKILWNEDVVYPTDINELKQAIAEFSSSDNSRIYPPQPSSVAKLGDNSGNGVNNGENVSALSKIPSEQVADKKGNVSTVHHWEQAEPGDTYDALTEIYHGNADRMNRGIKNRISKIDKDIKSVQKKMDAIDDSDDFDAVAAQGEQYDRLQQQKDALEAQKKKYWQRVQGVPVDRQAMENKRSEAEQAEARQAAEQARAEADEQARQERERTNGVPDVINDKPADARARGFRNVNGTVVERQGETTGVTGREGNVKFSSNDTARGRIKVIEADELQPSHVGGQRNTRFFIDEAQPKNRTDAASSMAATKIAENLNPAEITGDGSAYQFSAPTVNSRGEVIQGNNRSEALKLMYSSDAYKPAQEAYKQYIADHAEDFGFTADDVNAIRQMKHPVMVNEIDADDDEAIRLGQMRAADNESGGIERIDPVTTSQKLGSKAGRFASVLLSSSDEDASLSDLMVENGHKAVRYLEQMGAVSPTQVQSAFDGKGNLTAEAKMDLQNILKQSLFQGGASDLPTMFNAMPAKAQKAILSTFMRDFESAEKERILPEIQKAVEAWYGCANANEAFAKASNYKGAKAAMHDWTLQTNLLDDNMPSDKFSNFAMELACRLQGCTMRETQQNLNDFFDLVQGKGQGDLFGGATQGEQADRQESIRRIFGIEYKPVGSEELGVKREELKTNSNGENRSNAVADNDSQSGEGRQGGAGDTASGERTESAGQANDGRGRAVLPESERRGQEDIQDTSGRQQHSLAEEGLASNSSDILDENGNPFIINKDGTIEFGEITPEQAAGISTDIPAPIRLSRGNEDYGFIHMQKHLSQLQQNGYATVEDFVSAVTKGKSEIRQGNVYFNEETGEVKETFLLVKPGKKGSVLYIELLPDGDYYTVNSGGVFKNSYIEKRKKLWSASTEHSTTSGESQDFPLAHHTPESDNVSALSQSPSTAKLDKKAKEADKKPEKVVKTAKKPRKAQPKKEPKANEGQFGLVSDERMEELKKRLRQKLRGQLNMGVDPEILAIGLELTAGYIDRGVKKFADYAKAMIADLGDVVRPYLKAFYNGVRDMPEITANGLGAEMDDYETVSKFNVAAIGKEGEEAKPSILDTAEQISNEQTVQRQAAPLVQAAQETGHLVIGGVPPIENGRETRPQFKEPKPIGTGDFGPIYDQFKGNTQGAIDFLTMKKDGEALGALHHKDIGDIDLVWGKEGTGHSDGYGLAKLSKYHPEVLNNLQEILDDMHVTQRTDNRVQLESDTHQATVRLTWNEKKKTWLLTAFEKKNSALGNTTDTAKTSGRGERNDTATPQSTVSERKGKQALPNKQEKNNYFFDKENTKGVDGTLAVRLHDDVDYSGEVTIDGKDSGVTAYYDEEAYITEEPVWFSIDGLGYDNADWEETEDAFKEYVKKHSLKDAVLDDEGGPSFRNLRDALGFKEYYENRKYRGAGDGKARTDKQGNPIDEDGKLVVEKVSSIDELTDDDFEKPSRTVELPELPDNVDKAIGANGKPVIIKKNIFERNRERHEDITPSESRDILNAALYTPNLYGQNQKSKRPYNWVVINTKGKDGKNRLVLLETNNTKDNVEIVHWHYIDARGLEKIRKQAAREDGRLLILPSDNSEEAGALSSPTSGASNDKAEREGGELLILTPKGITANPTSASHGARGAELDASHNSTGKDIEKSDSSQEKSRKKVVNSQPEAQPSFFDDFFGSENSTNQKAKDNGLQGNDELRPEGLPSDGDNEGEHSRRQGEGASQGREGIDRQGEAAGVRGVQRGDDKPVRPRERLNGRNNHAERGKDYAPKGTDERIEANIAAIELMRRITDEGRSATPSEMKVLRRYSGWGGLGKAFNEPTWGRQNPYYKRLKDLFTDDEWQQAEMSRNSAYFTPAAVIDNLWDIARALGFKGGNVLEGSAGIGNIIGLMPEDMSGRSHIQAVEVDGTTGAILSLLYPDANVNIQGFEQTKIRNGSVDLAITNVPFVTGLHVNDTTGDSDLSRKFGDIHDFCIAKNVRKLKPGGIGIFITSSGTMDRSQKLRDWLTGDGDADVIGAFRMNNETFGGTSATSDIIVVRKRMNGAKSPMAIDVSKVGVERIGKFQTPDGDTVERPVDYNQYFIDHPEDMGGRMYLAGEKGDYYRSGSRGLYPVNNISQKRRMEEWVKRLGEEAEANAAQQPAQQQTDTDAANEARVYEALGEDVKEGSMLVDKNGNLCTASYGEAVPLAVNANKVKGHTKAECFNDYKRIKDAVRAVLDYQTQNADDKGLKPLLDELNEAYDNFVNTYGHLNKNTAISFLKNDMDFSGIAALEQFEEYNDKAGKRLVKYGKSDIFNQRVVEKEAEPHPTTVKDGVITSIYRSGRIDLDYIANELGKDKEAVKREILDEGLGFEDPVSGETVVSYEYLSGNVREKLAQAREQNEDGRYNGNIKALEKVIPMDIPAHLIEYSLGSSWLDPQLYEQYIEEKTGIRVKARNIDGTWAVDVPGYGLSNEKNRMLGVTSDIVGKTVWGHELIIAAMKNKSVVVQRTEKHYDGSTETISDKEATRQCGEKIDEIRQDFKDWARGKMQQDPELAKKYETIYNDQFNNYVPKSIPDSFVPKYFSGATHKITLRPHQAKAAIMGTTQNVLLAHEVGSGKTFTLISTAMEMRRLGTARKPMVVVQNATVGQFVSSAKFLYPGAKILTIEDKDREKQGRKAFYAKIKYNDWDMIVVPQSVLDKIPDSDERQLAFVQAKVQEKERVLQQMSEAGVDDTLMTRRAQKELETLNGELQSLSEQIADKKKKKADGKKAAVARQNAAVRAQQMLDRQVDDVESFDDMGIDALLVDEAHEYKHLGFATAMQRGVKGVDPSYSKKSQGLYLKCQSVMERTGGKNIIFATGTPISNTAAEIWTFMKYLMPEDTMKDYGIYYFDDFVRNFGDISQIPEFNTSGKFVQNNRFKGYQNLPELVRIWSGVSDTVLSADIEDLQAKIPEMRGGKAQDIYLPQTRALRSVMKYVREQLNKFEQMSGKEKKENSAIPLMMYGIAKAAAVDPRLVMENAEDDPKSKTNACVRETLKALEESKDYQGTVAVFADNYQNKHSGFNLFEDIKEKLVKAGIPEKQVVIIKPGMKVNKKTDIFDKVNGGQVRVVLGSTATLGTGVNMQERLYTLIHLDAPNRPMDYTQRNGRILRQGNLHKEWNIPVKVIRFGVEDSLDVTAYQRLKTKGAIADSIMHGKELMRNAMENRTIEEEEDQFGDTVAQLSGSEYALLKQQAERELRKYEGKKKQWEADQVYIHAQKPRLEGQIREAELRSENAKKALDTIKGTDAADGTITIGKRQYAGIDAMGDFIKEFNKRVRASEDELRKSYGTSKAKHELDVTIGGIKFHFTMSLGRETESRQGSLFDVVKRRLTYSCKELNLEDVPVKGGLLRNGIEDIMQNVLTGNDFREMQESAKSSAERLTKELEAVKGREGKPFEFGKQLDEAKKKVGDYTEKMKTELDEKQKKYAEMDAEVAEADINNENATDDDVLFREDDDIDEVNERFNKELSKLTQDNADSKVFYLGRPSAVLRSAGVADMPMKLYGSKIAKKAKKHGFNPQELEDLPRAVADPIAVFDNYNERGNRSILTELRTKSGNFLVTLSVGKGMDVDFNIVSSVFGKSDNGIVNWLNKGYATYINKEKALNYLHLSAPIAEALDSSELSSVAKVVRDFKNPVMESENLSREGEGAYSDEELSEMNDPFVKMIATEGNSKVRTQRRQREFAERERRRMADAVRDTAERLHLTPASDSSRAGGKTRTSKVEVRMTPSGEDARADKAKGYYIKSQDKIVINIYNHSDVEDALKTLLHEGVAHYGLRQLFGDHFDTFLRNVYEAADNDVRRRITDLALYKYGGRFDIATEEYLASLAEQTDFENMPVGFWQKIKELFLQMLHAIGFDGFADTGVRLSDNELRYILWRSYENLKEPGRYRSILGEAADVAKQYELGVGNYESLNTASSAGRGGLAAESDEAVTSSNTPDGILKNMHDNAEAMPTIELTPENWRREFGTNGEVNTPLGIVKLGESQYAKLVDNHRTSQFGMIKPTLERPDVVLETYDPEEGAAKDTKYLFIKAFQKHDGTKYIHFESVSVRQGDKEVVISNHIMREGQLRNRLKTEKILWNRFENDSETSGEAQGLDNQTGNRPTNAENGSNIPQSISAAKLGNNPELFANNSENVGEPMPPSHNDSDRRQRRKEVNHTIDEAVAFVTGKTEAEARAMRLEQEHERKREFKEIRDKVLSGDFNDVTLRQIDKYISDATPENPFGRRISQRVPQKMERSLHEGERTGAVDALFTRICESYVRPNERLSRSGREKIARKKKEILEGWAKATGHWHTRISDFTNDTEPIGKGNDSVVYLSKDGNSVIKFSHGKEKGKFMQDIDAVNLFNYVFPNSAYKILGYGNIGGQFVKILQQPLVDFTSNVPLTVDERAAYMDGLGFKPLNKDKTVFSNGEMVAADLQKSNIVKDKQGNVRVIDADVKLHTKDIGGSYTYMPVESELPEEQPQDWGKGDLLSKAAQITEGVDGDLLFRDSIEDDDNTARQTYNAWADAARTKIREAWQDSMINVRNLQEAVLKQRGERLENWEDAYNAENQSHGISRAESENFDRNMYKPLLGAVNALAKEAGVTPGDVAQYMMAKHGLERNVKFAERDASEAWKKYQEKEEAQFAKYEQEHPDGGKTLYDFLERSYGDFFDDFREKDYGGLTGLTGTDDIADAEAEAWRIVNTMEDGHREAVDELWGRVNAATKWTLKKSFDCGIISKDNYDYVRDMFEYYIPLRGWDETTADEIYDYIGHKGTTFSPTLHRAKGRSSMADNPIAYIAQMAVSAIAEGNRNRVKQAFLYFVQNHPTNLVTVTDMWYRNYGTADMPDWREDVPDIPEDATAEEIAGIVEKHEEQMEQLKEQGLATKERGRLRLGVPIRKGNALEHHVEVLVNGKKYVLYINGNPRAAQALNGTRASRANTDSHESGRLARVNRWLGQAYTSLSPAFTVKNFFRDYTMATALTFIKEGAGYARRFQGNMALLGGPARMFALMRWYGTLGADGIKGRDDIDETRRLFYEFMTQGAETGFTSLSDIDRYKRRMEKEFGRMNQTVVDPRRIGRAVSDGVETVNRCIEDTVRFATYMTSRKGGKSIKESVADAKNVTLNFNRKGSGEMGNATFRHLYIFVNPAIQGLHTLASAVRHHPVRFSLAAAGITAMGMAQPLLISLMWGAFGGGDGDDDWNPCEEYWKLPTWQRRSNYILWIPGTHKFAMIPLGQEFRTLHGIGETMASFFSGHKDEHAVMELVDQATSLLPLDFTGNNHNPMITLMPSMLQPLAQVAFNTDFTGKPLYKDSEWNKYEPSFQKAYVGTPSWLVSASAGMNELTGGNDHRQGWIERTWLGEYGNNPAVVDHMLKGYMGGMYSFFSQLGGDVWKVAHGDKPDVREIPVVNRVVTAPREKTVNGKTQLPDWYWNMVEESKREQNEYSGYKKDTKAGVDGAEEHLGDMEQSEEFTKQQQVRQLVSAVNRIRSVQPLVAEPKNAEEEAGKQQLEEQLREVLKQLDTIRQTGKAIEN